MNNSEFDSIHQGCPECARRGGRSSGGEQAITSISLSSHNDLFEALASGLQSDRVMLATTGNGLSRLMATPDVLTQIHTTPQGDVLATAATASGLNGKVRLVGSIGAMPHALAMDFTTDLQAKALALTLKVDQPIKHDYTWHFNFGGIIALPNGNFMASSLELDTARMAVLPQLSIDWGCVAACGGNGIRSAIDSCLTSTGGDPVLFVGCLVLTSGAAVAGIAWCIARNCIHR